MRRVELDGPKVLGEQLCGTREGSIVVGSASWHAWLAGEGQRSFVFSNGAGEWYRARREWRRECAYWYVACRVGTRVRRFYLGAAGGLDGARLQAVASAIAVARAAAKQG